MATVVLGVVGGTIGWYTGGAKGAQLGWSIGTLIGAGVEGSQTPTQEVGRASDVRLTGSSYGTAIQQLWGKQKVSGNVVWSSALQESSRKTGIRIIGTRRRVFSYSISLAVAWCRGPVTRVKKILAEDIIIYDDAAADPAGNNTIRHYLGTEWQTKDSLISADKGAANTPAYRGLCYTVFEDLALEQWSNRIPNLTAVIEADPSALVLQDYPLMYWRFEDLTPEGAVGGKLVDWGAKAYDLADVGGTSTQVAGWLGDGISTVGMTMERTIGQDLELQGAEFSISLRYRFKGVVGNGAAQVAYISDAGRFPWKLRVTDNIFTSTTHLVPSIHSLAAGGEVYPFTSGGHSLVRDEAWHQVVWTHDATNDTLYHDGVQVAQAAAVGNPVTVDSNAANYLSLEGNGFEIDEVAFYDTILDAATIANQQPAGVQVRHIAADVFEQVGLTSSQYDLDEADNPITGYLLSGRTEARQPLSSLLQFYALDLAETDGLLKAIARGGAAAATISADDLGCRLWAGAGGEPENLVSIRRIQDVELPRRVDLTYYSQEKDFEQSTQGDIRYTKSLVDNHVTITTPLVLTETEARQAATRIMYDAWIAREQYQFALPWTYDYLTPGDVVNLPVGASLRRVRITQITAGLFGPRQYQAVLDDAGVLIQVVEGAEVETSEEQAQVTETTLVAWSNNAIVNEDADSVGYYVAAAGATTGYWSGAQLYQSNDSGGSYQEVAPLDVPAIMGTTTSVLAAGTTTGLFDDTNTVNVTLTTGTIASVSDADLLAGENLFLVGDEYVLAGTVTPLGGNSYTLSHLLRGRRGTDSLWGTHASGEAVVLVEDGLYTRIETGLGLQGKQVLLKAVTSGSTLAETTSVPIYVTGAELWPWAPVTIEGTRDGGNNLTVTWQRRDRKPISVFAPTAQPMSETTESYTVEILSGVPKTITGVTQALSAVVTSTAHGLSVGQDVYFSGLTAGMVQLNGRVGEITAADANTFTVDIDTRYFTAYTTGGTAEQILRSISASSETAAYSAANQTTDGLTPGNPVSLVIYQHGALGRGYGRAATV